MLEAVVKRSIAKMLDAGVLTTDDMEKLMSKPGRFRNRRGLRTNRKPPASAPTTDVPEGEGQAEAVGETTETSGGFPFMITHDMKARLSELGYSAEQIANLKPDEAHHILDNKLAAPIHDGDEPADASDATTAGD